MTILVPLLVALIGLVIYFASNNGKVSEAGRICFFAGLFVALLRLGDVSVSLLR